MKKKLVISLVTVLLIVSVIPISGGTNNNLNFDNLVFLEINETQSKVLTFDGDIGDIHVQYWKHVIDGVIVKNDSILLHTDIEDDSILSYEKSWENIDFVSPIYKDFEPQNIFCKQLVLFPDEDDCTYFYTFDDLQEYPIVCWEVRYSDGTTIMYDLENNKIGQGVPTPSEVGFSLNGYDEEVGTDCWMQWRMNADSWFKKWCISTVSLASPPPTKISNNVQNPDVSFFYQLAHGDSNRFLSCMNGFYCSSDVKSDMDDRQAMTFAFIGSCHGMSKTDSGTFSYEFRKGQMTDTVTVGYDHMEENIDGWIVSIEWQEHMFKKMSEGLTIKESFDLANAQYPAIEPSVVFVGDESLRILIPSPEIDGPTRGIPLVAYSFSIHSCAHNGNSVSYLVDWGDNTLTDWIGPYSSNIDVTISHEWSEEGEYEIKVKTKFDTGRESNWSSPLKIHISNDHELPSINIISPQTGYLYLSGEQKRETFLGGTVIIGEISFSFDVSDNIAINKVELFVNNNLVRTGTGGFTWDWEDKGFGRYNLKVVADDWVGNTNSYEIDVWKFF